FTARGSARGIPSSRRPRETAGADREGAPLLEWRRTGETGPMRRAVAVAALLLSLPIGGGARGADKITGTTLLAVRDWVAAVREHTPGRRDAAATTIAPLTFGKQ